MLTFAEYLQEVAKEKALQPHWRMGQTYFNVLYAVRMDLSEQIRGNSKLDPFHQDDRIGNFLSWVAKSWEV